MSNTFPKLDNVFLATFLLLSSFSYVSFSLTSFDTQIWHVFFIPFLLVFYRSFRVWKSLKIELFYIPLVFVFFLFSTYDFMGLRSYLSYTFFFLVFAAVAQSISHFKDVIFYRIFCISSFLYFIFGASQYIWGRYVFEFLVHVRGTDDRGVSSLAAEPSYYASISLLLSWLILIFSRYRPSGIGKLAILFNVISIVFLAQSAIGIMYIAIAATLVFLSGANYRFLVIALIMGLIGVVFLNYFDGRASRLIDKLFDIGPYGLMMADASINLRFASFFLPLYISFDNYLVPMFFGHYLSVAQGYREIFGEIFWYNAFDKERIMSFLGAMIFEMGIFGLFYLVYYSVRAYRWSKDKVFRAKELIFLFALLVSPLPIAMPLVAIVFASILYVNDNRFNLFRYVMVK